MTLGDWFSPYAFGLGMVALFNPCGFALFPAYLGYFVGTTDAETDDHPVLMLNRAQIVGLAMSIGFLTVFGIIGIPLSGVMSSVSVVTLGRVTLAMGLGVMALGVAMLAGYKPMLSLPSMQKGTNSRSAFSMFLFGVSYAIASLSCTIGLFLAAVSGSGTADTFATRLGSFLSYGAGMGLMGTAVTLAVAFGQQQILGLFRKVLPYINHVSGVVLVVVGIYVAYYGYWQTDVFAINPGPILRVEQLQGDVASFINSIDDELGIGFVVLNVALVAAGLAVRRSRAHSSSEADQFDQSDWDHRSYDQQAADYQASPLHQHVGDHGYYQTPDSQPTNEPYRDYPNPSPTYQEPGVIEEQYPPPNYPPPNYPPPSYPPPNYPKPGTVPGSGESQF